MVHSSLPEMPARSGTAGPSFMSLAARRLERRQQNPAGAIDGAPGTKGAENVEQQIAYRVNREEDERVHGIPGAHTCSENWP
jgi:hypothetical protein